MRGRFGNIYSLGVCSKGQRRVNYALAVDVNYYTSASERFESGSLDLNVIRSDREVLKGVETLTVRDNTTLHSGRGRRRRDFRPHDHCIVRIGDGPQQGSPIACRQRCTHG